MLRKKWPPKAQCSHQQIFLALTVDQKLPTAVPHMILFAHTAIPISDTAGLMAEEDKEWSAQ